MPNDANTNLVDLAKPYAAAIVRHAATTVAGYLVANGFIDKSGGTELAGAIVALAAVAWSFWQKYGHQALLAELKRLRG